jgi:site-specific DNA recombinase
MTSSGSTNATQGSEAAPAKRVALYLRISTDETNQPYSVENQRTKMRQYAQSQEWEVVAEYEDHISGSRLNRPGLDEALEAAEAGEFDILLVLRLDRFARSIKVLLELIEILDEAGVAFKSATEPIDTVGSVGRMLLQILGALAEFERSVIIDRIKGGNSAKASKGLWVGGQAPYGYSVDKRTSILQVHPDEAPLVRRVFDLLISGGLGARMIADTLNDDGLRTRKGTLWTPQVILDMLRRDTYAGRIKRREEIYEGLHEPLITSAELSRSKRLIEERSQHATRRRPSSKFPLSGLTRCDVCGSSIAGAIGTGRSRTYRYYTCVRKRKTGKVGCTSKNISARAAESLIREQVIAVYADTELFKKGTARVHERLSRHETDDKAQRKSLTRELAKVKTSIDRYHAAFEAGTLEPQDMQERVRGLRSRRSDLEASLKKLDKARVQPAPSPPTDTDLAQAAQIVTEAMNDLTTPKAKAFLQAVISNITVDGARGVTITFRLPAGGDLTPRLTPTKKATGAPVRTLSTSVEVRGVEPRS